MESFAGKLCVFVRDSELEELAAMPDVVRLMAGELAVAMELDPGKLQAVAMERELSESTYVGRHLAVPHARVSGLECAAVYVARSVRGIAWGDGVAKVVAMTVAPEEHPEWYLTLLASVIRWRLSYAAVDELLNAPGEELRERLLSLLKG